MKLLRLLAALTATATTMLLGACSAPVMLLNAAGVATDTSVSWAVVKHIHDKLTDGDPVACSKLNSVERAVAGYCGSFVPGSIQAADIATAKTPLCPLAMATRDPQLWPVMVELIDKGAQPEACPRSPLVDLAQARPCPEFDTASPYTRQAVEFLADADSRAVRHDVVRMLSCPAARTAGLDQVLTRWQAQGNLKPGRNGFGALGALHPGMLNSPLAQALEADGHSARAGLDPYDGQLPGGFEVALRSADFEALDWWFARAPGLANRVPALQGNSLPWLPLVRVMERNFLASPEQQKEVVDFLLAHGASPTKCLPFQPNQTVLQYAQAIKSPVAEQLALALAPQPPAHTAALVPAGATPGH